jgi:RimJ/RimL family protein N-acetyltransferase
MDDISNQKRAILESLERLSRWLAWVTPAPTVTDHLKVPSWKLAERAGFELEGILRNERKNLSGGFRDTRVYSRVS